MQSAKFQRKLIYGGVAGAERSPIGTQEQLPRNFTSPLPTTKELLTIDSSTELWGCDEIQFSLQEVIGK